MGVSTYAGICRAAYDIRSYTARSIITTKATVINHDKNNTSNTKWLIKNHSVCIQDLSLLFIICTGICTQIAHVDATFSSCLFLFSDVFVFVLFSFRRPVLISVMLFW